MARKPSKVIQDSSFLKLLPQNTEAEESLFASVLLDNDVLSDIIEIITPHDFYKTSHQKIFEAILDLFQRNEPIDLITLANILKKKGYLEDIGGASYLAWLMDSPMAMNPKSYAKIIRDKACLRRLIEKSGEITRRCFEDMEDAEDIIDFAENTIFQISQDRIKPSFYHIGKLVEFSIDKLEERQGSNALVTGVSTGYTDLDRMTAGFQNSDLIILAARPAMGKCCEANTEIVLEDGSIATIAEIFQRRYARVLTLNEKLKFHITEPSDMIDDGKKPVFRLITDSGRCIETTLTHPFLTQKGWKSLEKLRAGDKIAVARRIEIFGKEAMRECEVRLLAYLVGDGNLSNITPGFTNTNPLISEDFTKSLEEFGETRADTLTSWLKSLGISGKDSHNKFIIPPIFRLPRDLLALFLNRVFAAGGWVSELQGQMQLSYASVSERLSRQIQHLLLRFGIISKLGKQRVNYAEAIRCCWQLDICDELSVKTFIEEIGIFATNTADLPKYKKSPKPAQNDIYWDKIVSIEFAGTKQVYDLTIPDTHNFVGNDICVHNTSLALNIARNVAISSELPVAVFSLEMSKEQLVMRMLCSEAKVDFSKLRVGFFSNEDWIKLTEAAGTLSEAPIFIDDTANISVLEIKAKARRIKAEKGLGLIMIDYLQLMRGRADAERRDLEISEISRSLKILAKELDIPVVALSQLNRKLEERTDKRPILSDLRESGAIEQDSDVVMFIYRDEVYHKEENNSNAGKAELIIAKQRNGPIGTVPLTFLNVYTRFENAAGDYDMGD